MYAGGGKSWGVPTSAGEDVRWRGEILGSLHNVWESMLEGGNPGVSLPLHNVGGRMYAGGGKSWGVPTSA